jgi:hypothetical protein
MDREAQREKFRLKNERRRKMKSQTVYAAEGKELREKYHGAFGKAPATLYNRCAEGTTAIRRAEHDLSGQNEEGTE